MRALTILIGCCLALAALGQAMPPPPQYRPFPDATSYRLPPSTVLVTQGTANVLPGAARETVLVLGRRVNDPSSQFLTQVYLLVRPERGGRGTLITLPESIAGGYAPTLHLRDFTGDRLADPMVAMATGGSGGMYNGAIYSFARRQSQRIFASDQQILPRFSGHFLPNYQAIITLHTTPQFNFIVNLADRQPYYDQMGLYQNGRLLKATEVWGEGYMALMPIDPDRDGVYGLGTIQQVRGLANVDRIAQITATMSWRQGAWRLITVTTQPIGANLSMNPS